MKLKKTAIATSAVVMMCSSAIASAEDAQIRYGLGAGIQYSGLGGSVQRVTDRDMIAVGVGMVGNHSVYGTAFGAGVSYQRADIIGVVEGQPNRHALGGYLGAVGHEGRATFRNGRWTTQEHNTIWGFGLTYNYFQNGINSTGWSLGAGVVHGNGDFRSVSGLAINLGYQF